MLRNAFLWIVTVSLAACSSSTNFTPREKAAIYDPETRELTMPYPCPDWSQSQTENYRNENHSNHGCAVNTNSALQVADPADLYRGHGDQGPDIETTTGVVQLYRAGKLPAPLVPQNGGSGNTGGASQ